MREVEPFDLDSSILRERVFMRLAGLAPLQAIIVVAASTSIGHAAERKLTGPEIAALFAGNSVEGVWGARHYRSYFGADGSTLYQAAGEPQQSGRWRASDTQYCSVWEMGGESCYDIFEDGTTVIWGAPDSGKRYESTLIEGKAVPW